MLLTAEVIKAFNEDVDKVKELLCDKDFYNEKVIEHYEQKGKLLSAREISALCGVSEQSANRTFKKFKEKLR